MQIRITPVTESDEWNSVTAVLPHSVFHSIDYCCALSVNSVNPVFLASAIDGDDAAAFTFALRSKSPGTYDAFSPYGFGGLVMNGNGAACLQSLLNELATRNFVSLFLMQHPCFELPSSVSLSNYRTAYVMDLSLTEERLWKNMGSGHTYEIKKLRKAQNLVVSDDKLFLLPHLLKLHRSTSQRVGASEIYNFSEIMLTQLVQSNMSMLLGAVSEGKVLAVVLLLFNDLCAEYFINATEPEGKSATRLLLWEGITRLRSSGVKKFNLGGGITEGDALDDFKRRMGGEAKPIKVLRRILNSDKFEELCTTNKANPNDTYFPPYWRTKNLTNAG